MRFELLLDPFYVLQTLWGPLTGSPVCTSPSYPMSSAVHAGVPLPGATRPTTTAFVDVEVVPMDTERVLSHQTVLVEGGRITALGPSNTVKVPAGALRIDGRGKYLMPGLSDMHTHPSGYQDDPKFADMRRRRLRDLAGGVTLIRYNAKVNLALKQMWHDSMPVGGPSPRLYLAPDISWATPADSMAARVAAAKAAGYEHILVSGDARQHRPAFDSLLAAARRHGLPRSTHTHDFMYDADETRTLGAYGGSNEHLIPYWNALAFGRTEAWDSSATGVPDMPIAKLQALAATTQQTGVSLTPTLRCLENKWPSPAHIKILRQLTKALQDGGINLLLGADDGWDVHDELAALVGAGLTPYQALRTGTHNAAKYLGELDTRGTVAVGKWADLVLLYGNPLTDVRQTREPAGVMIAGQWRDRATLDQLLLASPETWLLWAVNRGGIKGSAIVMRKEAQKRGTPGPGAGEDMPDNLAVHRKKLELLIDSLKAATAAGRDGEHTSQSLQPRIAEALSTVRAILTPEQHALFDPIVRVWLREQARLGRPVVVAGIAPKP